MALLSVRVLLILPASKKKHIKIIDKDSKMGYKLPL